MERFDTICNAFEATAAGNDSAAVALSCRDCVLDVVKLIFDLSKVKLPESASMLELLDSPVVTGYIDNAEVINALQFVRILGINAQHGQHIKKTEAQLARNNTAFFLGFIRNKLQPEQHDVK